MDIQTEHERYLTEVVFKKPVFVTDYPKEIKSFYMKQNPDGKTVAAADMLVPGIGELIGGSQREENYDKLVARMDELGMDKTNYDWYLNLRKFGGVEHAGYGLGFERMIMYLSLIHIWQQAAQNRTGWQNRTPAPAPEAAPAAGRRAARPAAPTQPMPWAPPPQGPAPAAPVPGIDVYKRQDRCCHAGKWRTYRTRSACPCRTGRWSGRLRADLQQ